MSQEFGTPSPPPPAPSLPWNEVWISALTQPSVATFEGFVQDPNATDRRAYTWVFVSALIGNAISLVLSALVGLVFGIGTPEGPGATGVLGSPLIALIRVPIGALLSVLMLMIIAGITQLIAGALGGTGTYSELVYAFAAYTAPLTFITSVLSPIPYINFLIFPLGIYRTVLNVIAVKAVNQFGWGRAIASSVLILAGIILGLIACMVVAILLLLGPVVGNVFSNIVENI